VQSVRDKRRKLRERGEKIEKDLATETVWLTRIFERVADSLLGDEKAVSVDTALGEEVTGLLEKL
jgi:hypothetical protein